MESGAYSKCPTKYKPSAQTIMPHLLTYNNDLQIIVVAKYSYMMQYTATKGKI